MKARDAKSSIKSGQGRVTGLGALLLGLVAIGFGDFTTTISQSSPVLIATFVTAVVVAGALLARSWTGYQSAMSALPADDDAQESTKSRAHRQQSHGLVLVVILVMVSAAVVYVTAVWSWATGPDISACG